jgi:hypothetical protein
MILGAAVARHRHVARTLGVDYYESSPQAACLDREAAALRPTAVNGRGFAQSAHRTAAESSSSPTAAVRPAHIHDRNPDSSDAVAERTRRF